MKRTLTVTLSSPEELDPRRVARFLETLFNRGTRNYSDVTVDDRGEPSAGLLADVKDTVTLADITVTPGKEDQFADAIFQIRSILWQTPDGWDGEKEWDSETVEYIASVLEDLGLKPL